MLKKWAREMKWDEKGEESGRERLDVTVMREWKGCWVKASKFIVEERRSDHERAKYCKGWRSRAQRQ